jgi:GxxExxY protein
MTASAPSPIGVEIAAMVSSKATGEIKPQMTQITQIFFMLYSVAMDHETYDIIGAALAVHSSLVPGFLEAVYKEALSFELAERGIPFSGEIEIPVFYKGSRLKTNYRSDFICHGSTIVELKAISKLGDLEMAQVLNYLPATGFRKGLLFNFDAESLEKWRLVM